MTLNFFKMDTKVETTYKNGLMYETKSVKYQGDSEYRVSQISVFTDKNHDGKYTQDEVSRVTHFDYNYGDKSLSSERTYTDKDLDGYSDHLIIRSYDKNGNISSEEYRQEEDINRAKSKYGENSHQVMNRNMQNHYNGMYAAYSD